MNILYVVERFPSKTEYFILNEILEIERRGFDVMIAAKKYDHDLGIDVLHLKNKIIYLNSSLALARSFLYVMWFYPIRLASFFYQQFMGKGRPPGKILPRLQKIVHAADFVYQLRNRKPDHIHAHFLFWPSKIAICMSQLFVRPLSLTAHARDIYSNDTQTIQYELRQAKIVFTCTAYNKKYLANMMRPSIRGLHHIYHGIDLRQWPFRGENKKIGKKKIQVLSIGRLVEKKGFLDLLVAIKELNSISQKYSCVIVGDGPLRPKLDEYISLNNLTETVCLINPMEQHLLKNLYDSSDMFVLPCVKAADGDMDGLPNVIVEAMATGLPVIGTEISGIPELIEHRKTGILVKPHSTRELCNAIAELAENVSLRTELSVNGRKKIEEYFAIESSTARMVGYLEDIHAKNKNHFCA